jgi:hypothetical protein
VAAQELDFHAEASGKSFWVPEEDRNLTNREPGCFVGK